MAVHAALCALCESEADVPIPVNASYYRYEINITIELLKWLYTPRNDVLDEKDEVFNWLIRAESSLSFPKLKKPLTKQLECRRQFLQQQRQARLKNVIEILSLDESKITDKSYYHEILVKQLRGMKKQIKNGQKSRRLQQCLSRLKVYNPCAVYLLQTKPRLDNFPPNLSVCVYPLENKEGSYQALITHSSGQYTTQVELDPAGLLSIQAQFDWQIDQPWDIMIPWFQNPRQYNWDNMQDVQRRSTNIFSHGLTENHLYQQLRGIGTTANSAQMERTRQWVKSRYKLCDSKLKIDTDCFGNTLLHTACYYGCWEVAAYLIKTPLETLAIPIVENCTLPSVYSRRFLNHIITQYRSAYCPNMAQRLPHMIAATECLQKAPEEKEEKEIKLGHPSDERLNRSLIRLNQKTVEQRILEENPAPKWLINELIALEYFPTVICWLISSTQITPIASLISSLSTENEMALAQHVAQSIVTASTDEAKIIYDHLSVILSHLMCQHSDRRATWGKSYRDAKSWQKAIEFIPNLHEQQALTWSQVQRQLIDSTRQQQGIQRRYMADYLHQQQRSWTLSSSALRQQLAPRHVPSDRALVLRTGNPWWSHHLPTDPQPAFKALTRWIIKLAPQSHIEASLRKTARCADDITNLLNDLDVAIHKYIDCQNEIYQHIDANENPASLTDESSAQFEHLNPSVIRLQKEWKECRKSSDILCRRLLADSDNPQQTKTLLNQWRRYIHWQHRCKRYVLANVLKTVLQTYTSRLHAASNYGKYVREVLCRHLEQWMQMQRGSHSSDGVVMLNDMVENEIETWVIAQLCEGLMAANEYVNDKPLTPRIQIVVIRLEQVLADYSLPSITQVKQRKISAERKQALKDLLSELNYYLTMQAAAWEKVAQGQPQAWVYHPKNVEQELKPQPSQEPITEVFGGVNGGSAKAATATELTNIELREQNERYRLELAALREQVESDVCAELEARSKCCIL